MDQVAAPELTLSNVTTDTLKLFQEHAGPLLLLCSLGVGFDALLTYGGGLVTLGYGEPFFALLSVVVQEVLYFGPAVLLWGAIQAARGLAPAPTDPNPVGTLFSGFGLKRAWTIGFAVTGLYMVAFSILLCIGTILGGFVLYFVPGAFTIAIKVLRTIIGPVMGVGYLATAVAVARPSKSVGQSIVISSGLMIKSPLAAGLVLSVGGFLEQAAGLTVVLGIVLDAFLLAYAAALVRRFMDAGELDS